MVDVDELPKMKVDKKEQEMANLFASGLPTSSGREKPSVNDLHDALGFLP